MKMPSMTMTSNRGSNSSGGNKKTIKLTLTVQIVIAMVLGALVGLIIRVMPDAWHLHDVLSDGLLNAGGSIFINLMKMIVVPLVFISLICGVCNLDDIKKLGRIGAKILGYSIVMTAGAVILAITVSELFNVGVGVNFPLVEPLKDSTIPSLQQFLVDIFPSNPFQALANANILQIIVFALIFGLAINLAGDPGRRITAFLNDLNKVIMKTITLVMYITPYGVFCLIAILFAKLGTQVILQLFNYFFTVVLVLIVYTFLVYSLMLKFIAKLSPENFFRKMYGVLLFAFSVASSNATLPLALETSEHKLGIDNGIASFVLSLGTNINKNGTAIMQGVAAIFIAHAYNINIGLVGDVMIVLTATLASIGTAGAPAIGVLALVMVLRQVGLPIEGIAIVLAVDRFLDMLRTAVNVAGNAVIACIVGKNENKLDLQIYNSDNA
jgi:Na+/H+-dicarboxylate symporter